MDDIIMGFVGLGVACVLVIDLATQLRVRHISEKIDQILQKLSK